MEVKKEKEPPTMVECLACRRYFDGNVIVIEKAKEMSEDIEWIMRNYERLKEKYPENFIAVRKGKVILSEAEYDTLRQKLSDLKRKNPDYRLAVVEKVRTKPLKFLLGCA